MERFRRRERWSPYLKRWVRNLRAQSDRSKPLATVDLQRRRHNRSVEHRAPSELQVSQRGAGCGQACPAAVAHDTWREGLLHRPRDRSGLVPTGQSRSRNCGSCRTPSITAVARPTQRVIRLGRCAFSNGSRRGVRGWPNLPSPVRAALPVAMAGGLLHGRNLE